MNSTDNNDINISLSLKNPCTFLLAKEKTWKRTFKTNSKLSQKVQKNILCHPKQENIGYLLIYYVIYSLLILTEKMAFFNKQLYRFITSLKKDWKMQALK